MIWWWFYKMKKIMSLLLKSKKSEIKKFKNIKTCKLNAILDNFHNFGANLKIFSSLQLNFMENRYQIQNLKIWWIHENSYLKLRFFRNYKILHIKVLCRTLSSLIRIVLLSRVEKYLWIAKNVDSWPCKLQIKKCSLCL